MRPSRHDLNDYTILLLHTNCKMSEIDFGSNRRRLRRVCDNLIKLTMSVRQQFCLLMKKYSTAREKWQNLIALKLFFIATGMRLWINWNYFSDISISLNHTKHDDVSRNLWFEWIIITQATSCCWDLFAFAQLNVDEVFLRINKTAFIAAHSRRPFVAVKNCFEFNFIAGSLRFDVEGWFLRASPYHNRSRIHHGKWTLLTRGSGLTVLCWWEVKCKIGNPGLDTHSNSKARSEFSSFNELLIFWFVSVMKV